ncbi:phage portal protein, SPP1 family [Chitinophaga sp. YR573]|uniref:phage portal protein n=1 Tax=Chitinophaga sp. YR573 TaxID=1881040 RepID=UPI0008D839C8|nr:phage portal protein [Chitinophaga sp. YR573]SEV88827.1 phage portal protein, SPP1 family [Chitinophaga sp. YR573]
MELEELQVLQSGNYDDLVKKFIAEKPKKKVDAATINKQLDPSQHDVTDKTKRQDKTIKKKDDNGKDVTSVVEVARLPIPMQKRIVQVAAAFLCANPIKMDCQPLDDPQKNLLYVIKKTWDDNKLDYESMGLAEIMMGETECAELWYVVPADDLYWAGTPNEGAANRMRMRVLAPSLGDTLYPVYDITGDMIAFGRGYMVTVGDKTIEHFDFYTDKNIVLGSKEGGAWTTTPQTNATGKIPIIYYTQPQPEWTDVQPEIDRIETSTSNNADTNDYFGSPMMKVGGKVTGFSDKGESGKVIQTENGATVEYLTWEQASEAVKLENERLEKVIYSMTDTPNISFDEMKGLGTFSGIALKMLFLAAHLKAARKEGIFGKGIQRRINFLKAAMAKINVSAFEKALTLNIKPVFEYYLPKNIEEIIGLLTEAVGGGKAVMSQESAIRQNPLVTDADTEIKKMTDEGLFGTDIANA